MSRRCGRPLRVGFVMEQTLGHVTHYGNMRATIDADPTVYAQWYPLTFAASGRLESLPPLRSNWTVRASWRAWRALVRDHAEERYDALFFHTQVTTLLCARLMSRVPSVVSLDATPINYDAVGSGYGHRQAGRAVEGFKHTLNVRPLHAARALVTWCDWARQSLVDDYGLQSERITVVPPGVNLDLWPRPTFRDAREPVRILFVGADFARKGGEVLLEAFAGIQGSCELHLVTKTPVKSAPRVFVYHDATPNSELLRNLYATADLFVLPTLADCFPLVIQEAMAAGLPVVATDVGAIGEAVHHGETGLLVAPADACALRDALDSLIGDTGRRIAMGARGRELAVREFDSVANARRILDIINTVAGQ